MRAERRGTADAADAQRLQAQPAHADAKHDAHHILRSVLCISGTVSRPVCRAGSSSSTTALLICEEEYPRLFYVLPPTIIPHLTHAMRHKLRANCVFTIIFEFNGEIAIETQILRFSPNVFLPVPFTSVLFFHAQIPPPNQAS
jgi:hypothetical protein